MSRIVNFAQQLEQERALATLADKFKRPWKVVYGGPQRSYSVPRIVDRDGAPIMSFGNQRRWWGQAKTGEIADLIVDAVNSRDDVTWKDSAYQTHFKHAREYGLSCDKCEGPRRFSGMGTSNTPAGHDMIYAWFVCENCKQETGITSGFRYQMMGETTCINHTWDGEKFVRVWEEKDE